MLLWTLGHMLSLNECLWCFLIYSPGVELLCCMVALFSVSWEISILFSTVVAIMYVPISKSTGFPFLYIVTDICYLCSFWRWSFWQVWGGISLWFCISLLISDVGHPFMCLLVICISPLEKCLLSSMPIL